MWQFYRTYTSRVWPGAQDERMSGMVTVWCVSAGGGAVELEEPPPPPTAEGATEVAGGGGGGAAACVGERA